MCHIRMQQCRREQPVIFLMRQDFRNREKILIAKYRVAKSNGRKNACHHDDGERPDGKRFSHNWQPTQSDLSDFDATAQSVAAEIIFGNNFLILVYKNKNGVKDDHGF
jgi:hypothetical protein